MKDLPEADWSLADQACDADWFRVRLIDMGTRPCIPGRKSTARYDKRRNRIERMFGRIKD
jgi:hypothetical protein